MNQTPDQEPAAASTVTAQKRPVDKKRLSGALAVAGTLIGVLAAAAALFDWFGSKLDPAPLPPPDTIDAKLTNVKLRSRGERLVDYLRETNQSTVGLSAYEGSERGYVFAIRLQLQGNQGKPLPLHWSMIDARTGRRLPGPIYNQSPVVFKPRGPNQKRTWLTWVPQPRRKGTFQLRASLTDEAGLPLDQADSKPFTFAPTPGTRNSTRE